ncbi:uncharacterized protein SPAPADRAFT_131355, partial [Spathaspora passalidarum NRRL Y-27907]
MSGPQFAKKVENTDALSTIAKFKKKHAAKIKEDDHQILLRPSYGSVGIPTNVGVNFFNYHVKELRLFSYHVDLQSKVATKLKLKSAVAKILEAEPFKSKRSQIFYRDKNTLYSTLPLPIEDVVLYPVADGVAVKVQYIKELNFKDLLDYVQLRTYTRDFNEIQEYTNALLAVIGSKALQDQNVVGLGSNKFFIFDKKSEQHDFQKGLFITMGTFASIR